MTPIAVSIACPDRETARGIAAALVAERLAACAHVGPELESCYWWNGRVETVGEVAVLLKSHHGLFDAIAARVRDLHPYEVPAIVAQRITATGDYATWLAAETREA
jgi:periplasmic divalent cation tolerance protein